MTKLVISDHLSFPLDAVTQTFAILGIRGSGKTNTAVVMFEEMVKRGQQCAVLDPTDAWYGVRSSRDGKSAGLAVYVFGGEHGDLPLEGGHGVEMANFVVESGASVVFSLRHLTMNDQKRFAADFGERLRVLKAKPENRNPLHLFLDEAEEFVPQNLERDGSGFAARMFGAYNRMVRRDRNIGLGITLISQRPQSVNKEPLSQVETLICHRLLHKLDRKSVKESWVEGHDSAGRADNFFASLASLEKGDSWVWSPYWLDIFKQIHVRYRETFDSSFTPKAGERPPVAKVRAEVDLNLLRERLAATVEKAKADDPRELKRKIAELQKQVSGHKPAAPVVEQTTVEISVLKDADKELLGRIVAEITDRVRHLTSAASELHEVGEKITSAIKSAHHRPQLPTRQPVRVQANPTPIRKEPPRHRPTQGDSDLSKGERIVLTAIAQDGSGVDRSQLTVVTGYKRSTRDAYLQRLAGKGFISENGSGLLATDTGIEALGTDYEPLPTGDALREYWLKKLPEGERKILQVLIPSWPESVPREQISELTSYARSSRDAYLQRLASRKLIENSGRAEVRASDLLFDAGVSA
jgi:uncharacterized protein